MSAEALIRPSRDRPVIDPTEGAFKRLGLAAAIAAILHLLAFMTAGLVGWDPAVSFPDIEMPIDGYLELLLEVNDPEALAETGSEAPPEESLEAPPEAAPEVPPEAPQAPSADLPPDAGILDEDAPAPAADGEDRTVNLEETAPAFKSYGSLVRTAVARYWILPPAARSDFRPGRFVAVMTLGAQGQVLVIMVEESSGVPALDFAAMEALRGAAPYPPFPPDLADQESLNFRLHFDYRAVHMRPGSNTSLAPAAD
jgi:TonB family protein